MSNTLYGEIKNKVWPSRILGYFVAIESRKCIRQFEIFTRIYKYINKYQSKNFRMSETLSTFNTDNLA